MRRRALLGSTAALLGSGLTGCLGESGGSEPTTESTTSSTETTEYHGTTDDTPTTSQFDVELDVELERHQPGVLVMGVDSVGVRSDGRQYLYYRVDVTDGVPPERTDFGFRHGDRVVSPLYDLGSGATLYRMSETDDPYYSLGRGEGWLLFELRADRQSRHAAFALGSEEWPVDDAARQRLSQSEPPLTVDWGLADDQPEDAARLAFNVTNEGDVDTRFVAGLNGILIVGAHSPVAGFNREIPAGETVSWTYTHDGGDPYVASTEEESDSYYNLEWTQGEDDLYVAHAGGE
jgi:hypothetical protein